MTEENFEMNSNGDGPFEFDGAENVHTEASATIPTETMNSQENVQSPPPQSVQQTSQMQDNTSYESNSKNSESAKKGDDFRNTVSGYSVSMYNYAAGVKNMGHVSLADFMLRDLITIIISTNTAHDSIGRDKFRESLEEGYYASSRMIEYMKFLNSMGIKNKMYEPLLEKNERIHKVFAASLKTLRAKSQASPVGM